jgi:carbonyl reductase 1
MVPSRIAVVTGANKGIGYFIALQLGLSGLFSDIILGCRDSTRGATAMKEIQEKINESSYNAKIHSLPLVIGNDQSQTEFCERLEKEFGGAVDVLVNNAGFAYKGSDPTPFELQTAKTLEINYFGLVKFTQQMLPLLRKGTDARIVNVASLAGRLRQVSPKLQAKFTDPQLTIAQLNDLIKEFEEDVQNGAHKKNGWSNSNYGMSKLGVIAATKVFAREEAGNNIRVNCCCPGYCNTDMTSHRGSRPPEEGARNAVIPATIETLSTGEYFADYKVSTW